MDNIYVIAYVALSVLLYNLISYFQIKSKQKKILKSNNIFLSKQKHNFVHIYKNKIENKLFNLGYPYKLTTNKYIIFKYFLPIIIFIIAILNYKSTKVSLILFSVSFFTPNYLLYSYSKNENNILINEINSITNSMILNLSAYGSLESALHSGLSALSYKRFVVEYEKFIYEYKMYGYNIKQAANNLEKKFASYELSLFLSTLIQGDVEGNLLEDLKKFSETLELNYFKYIKKKSAERLMYVTLGTVLALVNIVLVVMYPIFKQVLDNLQIIFS